MSVTCERAFPVEEVRRQIEELGPWFQNMELGGADRTGAFSRRLSER